MKHVSGNLKYCRSISILIVSVIFLFSFLACYVFKEHVYFNLFSFDRKGPAVKETPKNVNNDHEVASESDQDVNSSVPNRKAEKTIEPLESCDIFTGEWVFDNITRPLYKEDECAFLRGGYLHEKWEAGFHVPELEMATERLFFSQVRKHFSFCISSHRFLLVFMYSLRPFVLFCYSFMYHHHDTKGINRNCLPVIIATPCSLSWERC